MTYSSIKMFTLTTNQERMRSVNDVAPGSISRLPFEKLSNDLRQAQSVINADYQQMDWEDRAFLNRVIADAQRALGLNDELA